MRLLQNYKILLFIILLTGVYACSKDDGTLKPDEGGLPSYLSGQIYFHESGEGVDKIDLQTGVKSTILTEDKNVYGWGWDISRDNKVILRVDEAPVSVDNYLDANLYTLTNLSTAETVSSFVDYHYEGVASHVYLSPDKTKIAVEPAGNAGIFIFSTSGNVLAEIPLQGESEIAWMPDGTLLFTLGQGIVRTNKDFTDLTLIKKLQFSSWGNIVASPKGDKIAFNAGNHIWMMNSDGSNLVQVTKSDDIERYPAFSPEGKYLALEANFSPPSSFGTGWGYLAIIPADGKTYQIGDRTKGEVIFIAEPKDKGDKQAVAGNLIWR